MTIFTKDTLRASVEAATGGKVTVLYDDKGYPSYMNIIPKFNVEDVDPLLGTGVHPMFLKGGVEKNEVFIGQHLSTVQDSRAVSLPGLNPKSYVNFDQAKQYCENKGSGWHLMTNWEWAGVKLWMDANGFVPRGNTNYGRSHEALYETAARVDNGTPGVASGTARTLTGSGPASWRHDGTASGISDLVGNMWEWQDGLKIVDGKIFMPADNNYSLDEDSWNDTGLFIDNSGIISDSKTGDWSSNLFWKDVTSKDGVAIPDSLKQACIVPLEGSTTKGRFYANNIGERLPSRGGFWSNGEDAGPGALLLYYERSTSSTSLGFRLAYMK